MSRPKLKDAIKLQLYLDKHTAKTLSRLAKVNGISRSRAVELLVNSASAHGDIPIHVQAQLLLESIQAAKLPAPVTAAVS